MKKFSFVIRTLNEAENLPKTIKIIRNLHGYNETEIIIVDSGSTDKTLEIAKYFSCVIVNISQDKWSWGRSLNLGIETSTGKYIAIISAHSFIVNKDFLKKSEEILADKNIAGVYGMQRPIERIDIFEELELSDFFPNLNRHEMDKDSNKFIGVSNACSVIRRDAWEECKYDEYVDSLEDGLWAKDIAKMGYKLVYTNEISIYHSHPFDSQYVYRKWYWRTYEQLNLNNYQERHFLVNFFIVRVLNIYRQRKELGRYKAFFKQKKYFSSDKAIYMFLTIKNTAIKDAKKDFTSNIKKSYWSLDIPIHIVEIQNKLKDRVI
jgi:rhamnosyltransferase